MIRCDCDKKKRLNIEHRLVSIGVHENRDKEQFIGIGAEVTGGKGWCPGPVHHKYITREWTKSPPHPHRVCPNYI